MARLETQINQIYLSHPDAKKASLVLYEETLAANLNLFVVAELRNLQRKSEANDLKKISEIILTSFRNNKKLPGETLFETALAQINQNLADLAHEGHKLWVGKLSCLIALRSGDNIFLANDGQTAAWLKRKSEMMEILPAEKLGNHPLKTFQNFSQGKLTDQDTMILTTSNIFNYVSFSLFSKTLAQLPASEACLEISKILQDSVGPDQSFCSFFISFQKKSITTPLAEPVDLATTYAPSPEETILETNQTTGFWSKFPKISIPSLSVLPTFKSLKYNFRPSTWGWQRLPRIEFSFFKKLSLAGKFFFISILIFLILFIVNLSAYGFKLRGERVAENISAQAALVAEGISSAQSALIYKNDQQAFEYLTQAQADYADLQKLSPERSEEFRVKLEQLKNQVNKTTVAENPQVFAEFNRHPIFLAKNPTGFFLSRTDSNSISSLNGTTNEDYFLLNSLTQEITSIAHWNTVTLAISVADKIYTINNTLKQFEPFITIDGSQIDRLKTYNNNLYALDTKNGRILRISKSAARFTTQTANSGDYSQVRDFSVDGDFYLLGADQISKISSGRVSSISLPFMTDRITNATRIFVGNNLYVLEPSKKRVVIMSKTGGLINQISFPTLGTPLDFYIDEASRNMYILDDNKLLRITF